MKAKHKWMFRTIALLALCVVFQALNRIIPGLGSGALAQILMGSLYNLTLITAAWALGSGTSMIIAILAAIIGRMIGVTGYIQVTLFMALGDVVIILLTWLLRKYKAYAIVIGAAGKFLFLYYVLGSWILPVLLENGVMTSQIAGRIAESVGYLQFVNAMIGGIFAFILWPKTRKMFRK